MRLSAPVRLLSLDKTCKDSRIRLNEILNNVFEISIRKIINNYPVIGLAQSRLVTGYFLKKIKKAAYISFFSVWV